ncbi:MAG: phosphoribosylanthranilate isomerase [Pseudomonadales bacterium]|nr:phosphoribosylanthranilate isomerase [Pseudomonadales bacterium]
MSGIWTKICGTTRTEDAVAAAEMGADALGLILFEKSPRAVDVSQCTELFSGLPERVCKVAIVVNPDSSLVHEALDSGVIDMLQFHGEEPEKFCLQFAVPYIKAIRVRDYEQAMQEINKYPSADMFLLDRFQKNVPGGTGKTFDWSIARRIVDSTDQRVVLAGGLSPDNVAEAINQVEPFGVDVISGVEKSHGVKDLSKVERFIEASKRVRS